MWHEWSGRKIHYRVLLGEFKEIDQLEDPAVYGITISKRILKVQEVMTWIGLIWLCRGANGRNTNVAPHPTASMLPSSTPRNSPVPCEYIVTIFLAIAQSL
jgi:hypothetical protein